MALGEGWAGPEEIQGASANWAVEQGARVFLPAAGDGTGHRLTVTALPFEYPGAGQQWITPEVNGQRLEGVALSPGWQDYTWEVPGHLVREGPNDVRFVFERLDAPADVLPGNGVIGGTSVQAPLAIEVNSGGPAGFAYITVGEGDGAEDGSSHQSGYNVAVIHPRTGKLLDRQGFDTTPGGSDSEVPALVDFVAGIPEGHIVAVALQDDGVALLTAEALAAFEAIGGQADPRGTTGWSHAIIGVKGAPPGTALEVAGPDNGWLRVAPDRRPLAAAVDAVVWERAE